jgi:hypothetical protein
VNYTLDPSSPEGLSALIGEFIVGLVTHIPMFLAYMVAIIIVIVRWREAPRASLLALLGMLLGLLVILVWPVIITWLTRRDTGSFDSARSMWIAVGVLGSLMHAVAFGLLFAAIYAGRASSKCSPATSLEHFK